MDAEVIEGTVESASIKRAYSKVAIYDSIVFRLADGSERRMEKVAVNPGVAEALQPGAQGRFYAYKAIDHKGLIAVRMADGRSSFAMSSGNERIMLVVAIIGLLVSIVVLFSRGGVSPLGVIMAVLGGFAYVSYRKLRIGSKARFDADSGYPMTA